jgi:hypothetical protein
MDGGAATAVMRFLLSTLRAYWGNATSGDAQFHDLRNTLLTELYKIQEDLNVLRDADKNVATTRFIRGFQLYVHDPGNTTVWQEDLTSALDSADNGYHRVRTTNEKIRCFEISCACFFVLRTPESAILSVRSQMAMLFDEPHIQTAFTHLQQSICEAKALPREDKELLESFLSRVCGVIDACHQLKCFNNSHREAFRQLFGKQNILQACDPTHFHKWDDIDVYKNTVVVRYAAATGHALVPIVPVLSCLAALVTFGQYAPRNAGISALDTKPLLGYDDKNNSGGPPNGSSQHKHNLYHFRWQLLDLARCKSDKSYQLGQISLTQSSSGGWIVAPS